METSVILGEKDYGNPENNNLKSPLEDAANATGDQTCPLVALTYRNTTVEAASDQSGNWEALTHRNTAVEASSDRSGPWEALTHRNTAVEASNDQTGPMDILTHRNTAVKASSDQNSPLDALSHRNTALEAARDQIGPLEDALSNRNETVKATIDHTRPLEDAFPYRNTAVEDTSIQTSNYYIITSHANGPHDLDFNEWDFIKRPPYSDLANIFEHNPKTENKTEHKASHPWFYLLALFLLGLTLQLQASSVSSLAPFFTSEAMEHGLSVTRSSVVFGTVFITKIISFPIFGWFIDKIGSVNMLISGSMLTGLANIAFSFVSRVSSASQFFGLSVVMRAITALGEAAVSTSVYSLIGLMSPIKYFMALACMEASDSLGTISGPIFGSLLFEAGGFPLPFRCFGILQICCGLCTFAFICWLQGREKKRTMMSTAVECDKINPKTSTVNPKNIFMGLGVWIASFVTIVGGMTNEWFQPILEPYLYKTFRLSHFQASLFLILDGGTYGLMFPFFGYLLDNQLKGKFRAVILFGSMICTFAFLLMGPFSYPFHPSLPQIVVAKLSMGIGMSAIFVGSLNFLNSLMERMTEKTPEEATAITTCIWLTSENIGGFLGSALGGWTYDLGGWHSSSLTMCVIHLSTFLLLLVLSTINSCLIS